MFVIHTCYLILDSEINVVSNIESCFVKKKKHSCLREQPNVVTQEMVQNDSRWLQNEYVIV